MRAATAAHRMRDRPQSPTHPPTGRVPPAAVIAAATIAASGALLLATALLLPHILRASWLLLPGRAADCISTDTPS